MPCPCIEYDNPPHLQLAARMRQRALQRIRQQRHRVRPGRLQRDQALARRPGRRGRTARRPLVTPHTRHKTRSTDVIDPFVDNAWQSAEMQTIAIADPLVLHYRHGEGGC